MSEKPMFEMRRWTKTFALPEDNGCFWNIRCRKKNV